MTRKTDSPRKRMREVIYRGPKTRAPTSFRFLEDPDDHAAHWAGQARSALSLREMAPFSVGGREIPLPDGFVDYQYRSIKRLFDYFKLNPEDPWHWRWLVTMFAYAEFWEGPKRNRGAKSKDERELAAALASLPSASASEAARKLAKKFAKGTSTSGLRRRIAKVRAKAGS